MTSPDGEAAPEVIAEFTDELAAYKFSKGSVQFPLNQPVPETLIIKMVKHRLSQLKT